MRWRRPTSSPGPSCPGRPGCLKKRCWPSWPTTVPFRAAVHQASGMVSVQLGISVGDALSRLRARAFAADRTIGDVAADVVARQLRFDE